MDNILMEGILLDLGSIGRNIRKYWLMRKLRQEDLAEKANLSINYIGAIERGEKTPSLETLIVIINTLGVSADMILADVIDRGYVVRDSLLARNSTSSPLPTASGFTTCSTQWSSIQDRSCHEDSIYKLYNQVFKVSNH